MKKTLLTIAIVLGLSMASFAEGGGLFQRGETAEQTQKGGLRGGAPGIPDHGQSGNQNAPLGTGVAIMVGLGAAYLVGKKRREE